MNQDLPFPLSAIILITLGPILFVETDQELYRHDTIPFADFIVPPHKLK